MTKRLLIQCVGNPLNADDGAGRLVAERLRRQELPADVEIREYWGEGTELLQDWDLAAGVILVDAADSGAEIGKLHQLNPAKQPIPTNLCHKGSHQFGVAEALETARALGKLPREIRLFAIEGADFRLGGELSPEVLDTVDRLTRTIAQLARLPTKNHG